jgi:hypothetical protein
MVSRWTDIFQLTEIYQDTAETAKLVTAEGDHAGRRAFLRPGKPHHDAYENDMPLSATFDCRPAPRQSRGRTLPPFVLSAAGPIPRFTGTPSQVRHQSVRARTHFFVIPAAGKVDRIIVYKLDRLGRSLTHLALILDETESSTNSFELRIARHRHQHGQAGWTAPIGRPDGSRRI